MTTTLARIRRSFGPAAPRTHRRAPARGLPIVAGLAGLGLTLAAAADTHEWTGDGDAETVSDTDSEDNRVQRITTRPGQQSTQSSPGRPQEEEDDPKG